MPSRDDAPEEPAPAPDNTDLVVLHGPTKDGEGAEVIRLREGRLELGEVRPLKADHWSGSLAKGRYLTTMPRRS